MKSFLILSCLTLSLGLGGCASLQSKIENELAQNQDKKTFQIRKLWVRDTLSSENLAFRKINRMTPILFRDLVIQGNSIDGVVAYRAKTGNRVWTFPILEGVEPSGILFKETLFIPGGDGHFYALKAGTGEMIWKIPTKTENIGQPSYDSTRGVVYFQTGLSSLYAVDAESGRILWTYVRQDTSQFSIRGSSRPSLYQNLVFSGFSDGSLVAFNKDTGSVVWEVFLNRNRRFRDIDASPVVDGDLIYVQAFDDQLYCISALQGSVQWKTDFGGYDGVLIDRENIFASTTDNQVVALDKKSGNVRWKYSSQHGLPTKPVPYKGMIVFGESQGSLVFLNAQSGKVEGKFAPGRGIMSTPAVIDPKSQVYFVSGEGNLYALEAEWVRPNWLEVR